MSIDQAKAFIERMKRDKAFADQVMAIEDVDEAMAFIKNAGFDFTMEEIKAVKAELSDDQLEGAKCWNSHAVSTGCKGLFC
jgi:predicted ribosomally synthesized peptide with nif11-like leader